MTDRVVCPTCRAELRLPVGAKTVRCPQCKTVLDVTPTAPPPPLLAKRKKPRVAVVDEAAEAEETELRARREKRKTIRETMDRIEDEKEEERERRVEMREHCRRGRVALTCFYWGMRLYALLFIFGGIITAILLVAEGRFAVLVAGLAVLACAASLGAIGAGFAYAAAGPPAARHYGWIGIGVTVVQTVAVLGQFLVVGSPTLLALYRAAADDTYVGSVIDPKVTSLYAVVGITSNFHALTDTPALLAVGVAAPWLGFFAGAVEFTRMVVLGLLVQQYAELGKLPETGFRSFRVISVYFWALLLATLFRLALFLFIGGAQPQKGDFIWIVINLMYSAINMAVFLTVMIQLIKFGDVIEDTREVVVADRYLATTAPAEL